MASAELSVVYSDDHHDGPARSTGSPGQALHRIQEVRRLQGMSLRTAARQLGTDIRSIRAQEQATTDLRLSDIYNWQRALDVPISELLVDEDEPLSRPVRERGAMLKIMKTARSLVEGALGHRHLAGAGSRPSGFRCRARRCVERAEAATR